MPLTGSAVEPVRETTTFTVSPSSTLISREPAAIVRLESSSTMVMTLVATIVATPVEPDGVAVIVIVCGSPVSTTVF